MHKSVLNRVYNFGQVLNSVHILCPKQGHKIEGSVLFRIRVSNLRQPDLNPNIGWVPPPLQPPPPTTPAGTLGISGFSCVWQWSAVEMFWVSRWLVYLQPKAEAMSSQGTNLLTSIHPTLTLYYLYSPVWLDVSHMLFLSECQAVVQVKFQYWSLKCVEMGTLVVSDQMANPYVQKNSV